MTMQKTQLGIGDAAPSFVARNQNGNSVHLGTFYGRYVLLHFIGPEADTATLFSRRCREFERRGTVVLAVAHQEVGSLLRRLERENLAIPLLADENGSLRDAFGLSEAMVASENDRGPSGCTVLLDPSGRIQGMWCDGLKDHIDAALARLEELGAGLTPVTVN